MSRLCVSRGANTVKIDNPKLTLKCVKGKPIRVAVSSKLGLDSSSNLFPIPLQLQFYTQLKAV